MRFKIQSNIVACRGERNLSGNCFLLALGEDDQVRRTIEHSWIGLVRRVDVAALQWDGSKVESTRIAD
jgi:hypothetical protein